MNHAPILFGISFGVSLLVSFGAVAISYGTGDAADRPSRGASILFGVGLALMLLIPMAAFSGEIVLLKAVLLLTGAFAVAGAVFGFRTSRAHKRRTT